MALVYKRSTKKASRQYARSAGMESNRRVRSNPGVNTLAVVGNPGRPGRGGGRATRENPFQWISGRGQRHIHESPSYRTVRGAGKWSKAHAGEAASSRLYPVDERGTIVSKPIPKRLAAKLTSNKKRSSKMAYNIGALRRQVRANKPKRRRSKSGTKRRASKRAGTVHERRVSRGMMISTRGKRRRRVSRNAPVGGVAKRKRATKASRRASARTSAAIGRVSTSAGHRRRSRSAAAKKAAKTRASKKAARSAAARKAARTRKRNSKRGGSKKRGSRKAAKRATKRGGSRRARATKRGGSRRARSSRRGGKRRSKRRSSGYFRQKALRLTGRPYLDKYLSRGLLPTIARVRRLPLSRSGRSVIMTYPIGSRIGRTSKRRAGAYRVTKRGHSVGATYRGLRKRRMPAMAANRRRRSRRRSTRNLPNRRRRSRRNSRRRSTRNPVMQAAANGRRRRRSRRSRRNPKYVVLPNRRRRSRRNSRRRSSRRRSTRNPTLYATANGRRRSRRNSRRRRSRRNPRFIVQTNRRRSSRRSSKRNSRRRRSRRNPHYVVLPNRRRSRRNSRRRSSKRNSRRRRSLRPNMLASSKVRWSGKGRGRMGQGAGRMYQLVEFGSKSRKRKGAGYPVLVPSHVSMHGYVRKFRFGGAAKDAHLRAKSSGYAERRKYARRRSLKANSRRHSMKRNSRRRRHTRRNTKYATANRRHRRVRRNSAMAWLGGADPVTDIAMPIAAGTAGFIAARVLSNALANVSAVRGMLDSGRDAGGADNTKLAANLLGIAATLGLSAKVPLIRRNRGALVTGMGLALADRLISKFAPTNPYLSGFGEYVSQPLGEYVSQPLGAYVNDPSAGMGEYVEQPLGETLYAAAGLGTMYATAGYAEGVDPANQDGVDGLMDAAEAQGGVMQAAAGMGTMYATAGMGDIPFESIQTPTDMAKVVTQVMPYDKPVSENMVTPEGRGYAGGVFARNLFGGMLS